MNMMQMNSGKKYIIVKINLLKEEEKKELYEIGLFEGEIISKKQNINNSSKVCIFDVGNLTYSINKQYAENILIEEVI